MAEPRITDRDKQTDAEPAVRHAGAPAPVRRGRSAAPHRSDVVTVRWTVTTISFSYSRHEETLLYTADGRLIERRGSGR